MTERTRLYTKWTNPNQTKTEHASKKRVERVSELRRKINRNANYIYTSVCVCDPNDLNDCELVRTGRVGFFGNFFILAVGAGFCYRYMFCWRGFLYSLHFMLATARSQPLSHSHKQTRWYKKKMALCNSGRNDDKLQMYENVMEFSLRCAIRCKKWKNRMGSK